jgi:hypothetical protein
METGMTIMNTAQIVFYIRESLSAVMRVEFVSDRMTYIILVISLLQMSIPQQRIKLMI